jgi:hypothetical protein
MHNTMEIKIVEVNSRTLLRTFINLPARIHTNHPNWVPPIYLDDRGFFNKKKNKSFQYCDTVLALAFDGDKPLGRIMGIINHRYNKASGDNDARFCFMETWNDPTVFHALMAFVENWGRQKGCDNMVGPLGFSDKDPQGFLVEGFNEPVVLATNCNFAYMPEMLLQEGYAKKVDCVVYKIPVPDQIPDFYKAIYQRALLNNHIHVLEFTSRKKIKPLIHPVLRLLNETFTDIYAFDPFEEREMNDFANRYLPLLDPQYIKIVTDLKGNIISFIIAMPDISKGIIACKGHVIPFGIFQIIHARKRAKQLNLLLGGVKQEFRGKGLDVIMGVKMLETARKFGLEYIDSHLELETNLLVRKEMERMGGVVYKRFRVFRKAI